MKVTAIAPGFYGGARRRVGETFDVAKGEKGKWFIPAPLEPKVETKQTSKPADPKSTDPKPTGANNGGPTANDLV